MQHRKTYVPSGVSHYFWFVVFIVIVPTGVQFQYEEQKVKWLQNKSAEQELVIFHSLFAVFFNYTSWFCSLLCVSVHWSISPTFLPNRMPLWRITSGREKSSDNRAGDERQTVTFSSVFIVVISLSHTQLVMLSHSLFFCSLLSLFYLLLLLFQPTH